MTKVLPGRLRVGLSFRKPCLVDHVPIYFFQVVIILNEK